MYLTKTKKIDKSPHCQHCKKQGVPMLIASSNKRGTINYMCRKCNTERAKKYRKTKVGKIKVYNAIYASIKRHPDRQRARGLLNYHIKVGKIVRPERCSNCGIKCKAQGHHKDYNKPLEVVWLCRSCHFAIHKRELV